MVISSTSPWVRPAQAVVNTESGEREFFPPRNIDRGLPRALTFLDYPGWRSAESSAAQVDLNPRSGFPNNDKTDYENGHFSSYSEDSEMSYLLATVNSTKSDIDDPPDVYESFDNEHFHLVVNMDNDSSVNCEIVGMSTPTEDCVMRHKRTSIQPVISPSISSTTSDRDSVCYSPLLPNEDTSSLSLTELVDLCTSRMEEARLSRGVPTNGTNNEEDQQCNQKSISNQPDIKVENDDKDSKHEETSDISTVTDEAKNCSISRIVDTPHFPTRSTSITNPLQLFVIDIQLLLQELNLLDDNSKSDYEDWISIPIQEMEALLINCYTTTVEFVLSE